MLLKIIVVTLLAIIVYNLFQALVIMNKNDASKPKMSKFIGRRLIAAIVLMIILLVGMLTGLITPNPHP